jgi:hypothetical protein
MQTRTRKTPHGYMTETNIPLSDSMQLSLTTMKRSSGQLTTTAVVAIRDGQFFAHRVFHDYNKTLLSSRVARCTPKALEAQHAQALQALDAIKDTINHHYATLN